MFCTIVGSKNHFIPFFDMVVFDSLLNRYGEHFVDRDTYDVGTSSITRNLHSLWVLDSDPFSTNQFMHPYQGATYHGPISRFHQASSRD